MAAGLWGVRGVFRNDQCILSPAVWFHRCRGYTALHLAAQEGHNDVVKHLLKARASIRQRNDEGLGRTLVEWSVFRVKLLGCRGRAFSRSVHRPVPHTAGLDRALAVDDLTVFFFRRRHSLSKDKGAFKKKWIWWQVCNVPNRGIVS